MKRRKRKLFSFLSHHNDKQNTFGTYGVLSQYIWILSMIKVVVSTLAFIFFDARDLWSICVMTGIGVRICTQYTKIKCWDLGQLEVNEVCEYTDCYSMYLYKKLKNLFTSHKNRKIVYQNGSSYMNHFKFMVSDHLLGTYVCVYIYFSLLATLSLSLSFFDCYIWRYEFIALLATTNELSTFIVIYTPNWV